jgi:predicted dehydrogenase
MQARWGVPTVHTLDQALAKERPDFAIVAVPWPDTPGLIRHLVGLGIPVLSETPPAPDLPGLVQLWGDIGHLNLVQVAEQYHRYPGHQARRAVINSGRIGRVNEVQLSSSHQYHMMSLIRWFLGVCFEPAQVTAFTSTNPLVNQIDPTGWLDSTEELPATTTQARLAFDSGRIGWYDFTDNQWWNQLRVDRALIRGSRGEILDQRVTRLHDARTVTTTDLTRWQTGLEMNLEGLDLGHISYGDDVVYRNRWVGGRLADDEIAVADMLYDTGAWASSGAGPGGPYPLAEACQDHALALAIDQSVAQEGPVRLDSQPWAAE